MEQTQSCYGPALDWSKKYEHKNTNDHKKYLEATSIGINRYKPDKLLQPLYHISAQVESYKVSEIIAFIFLCTGSYTNVREPQTLDASADPGLSEHQLGMQFKQVNKFNTKKSLKEKGVGTCSRVIQSMKS